MDPVVFIVAIILSTFIFFILIIFIYSYFKERLQKSEERFKELETIKNLEERNKAFTATQALNEIVLQTLDFNLLTQRIANAIPKFLGYETGVLAIVDEANGILKRVAISDTSGGIAALKTLEVPFDKIVIKLTETENYCIRALTEGKRLSTTRLYDVLRPVISEKNSDWVQKEMGTKTTLIYPIYSLEQYPLGVLLVSMNKSEDQISVYETQTISSFVDGVRIALQNANLYTALRSTSEKLRIANQKLEQLDRLKDEFVSVASHELRTPMTAIRSYAWMALNRADVPLSKTVQKYVVRILMSTERLINLVNDLLNVSRIESGKIEINPEAIDAISLIKDIIDEVYFSKFEEKHIEFVVLEKPTPKIFADPGKLRQVLLNLVGNSMKFTPNGGKITFDFFSDGKVVEISVSDTGVGISKEDLSKLFHKFSRLDISYVAAATSGGTGLGLYISKSLVELMHGQIKVYSEGEGKGTTFKVTLPAASTQVLNEAEKYKTIPKGQAKPLEPVAL